MKPADPAEPAWAREEDPDRIVHIRKAHAELQEPPDHTDENLDLENLLRVTPKGLFDYGQDDIQSTFNPPNGQHASSEEWQHAMARVRDGSIRGSMDDDVVLWIYNDHGADREYLNAPLQHLNPKGWVDPYRVPKYVYRLWQANFTDEPMVFSHTQFWQRRFIGSTQDIVVDSNCDAVELWVNSTRLDRQSPTSEEYFSSVFEDVEIVDGDLIAKCIDADGNVQSVHRNAMAAKPAAIRAQSSHETLPASRESVVIVEVDVVDAAGNAVPEYNDEITWTVSGPARLTGPAEYRSDRGKREAASGFGYLTMPVSNVIRSTGEPGEVTVKISSPHLEPTAVHIAFEAVPESASTTVVQDSLSDEGRGRVLKQENFSQPFLYQKFVDPIRGNRRFASGKPSTFYRQQLQEMLESNGIEVPVEKSSVEVVVDRLSDGLQRSGGTLIADDFNFEIARLNDYENIEAFIDSRSFHLIYADALSDYFMELLLVKRDSRPFDDVIRYIASIPRQHDWINVRAVAEDQSPALLNVDNVGKTLTIAADTLSELMSVYDESFAELSESEKKTVLEQVLHMNPQSSQIADGRFDHSGGFAIVVAPPAVLRAADMALIE